MDGGGQALLGQRRKSGSPCFVVVILTVLIVMYGTYTLGVLIPDLLRADVKWPIFTVCVTFQLAFGLFLMALITAIQTEPGKVPPHWGFYVGEEVRRRRYCRVCNVWKPDRTHHCSQCGRCVLNMDHHCPWINNCVGFYNRKFFIQTLIYANLCLIMLLAHSAIHLTDVAIEVTNNQSSVDFVDYVDWGVTITLITSSAVFLAGLVPFTRFHWHLLVVNSTTVESLDVANRAEDSRYDLGVRRNIEQVFGSSPWLWWLPRHVNSSRPDGDGVRWRRHYLGGTEITSTVQ